MSQTIDTETQTDTPSAPEPKQPIVSPNESIAPPHKGRIAGLFAWVWKTLPTLAVMAVLAGLGYAGHHTGWKIPKFSEISGTAVPIDNDWCEEHGVPELACVACNPDEYPKHKDYGWCKIHGVHQCPLHHPDVAQLKTTPKIERADLERADRALKLKPRPENNFACKNPGKRIQFATHESARKAGVDVEPVMRAPIIESITATGEIRYDETRLARQIGRASCRERV